MINCSQFTAEQCLELVNLANTAAQSFDPDVTNQIFYTCIKMWSIGLGVGIIFSLIRKLK